MGCSGRFVRTACCSGLLSLQSRCVLALFVYNCPECLSRRNRPKVIETSKIVELQLLRPHSPNWWSRVTWPAVGTVQLLRLVCRDLSLPRVLLNLSAFIQMPSEAYPTVIWTIVIIRDSMQLMRLFFFLKDMNPFCLSANDMDMVLLVSRPGPPPLDVSKGRCNAPVLLCTFTSFKYSIWEP